MLKRPHGAPVARRAHREIRSDPAFRLVTEARLEPIDELYERRPALSYADCVAVALALQMGEPLLTFDAAQVRALRARRRSGA